MEKLFELQKVERQQQPHRDQRDIGCGGPPHAAAGSCSSLPP